MSIARAYILIQVVPGRSEEIAEILSAVQGVAHSDLVTGPYDIILEVEAPDLDAIGDIVHKGVRSVEGIEHTLTCIRVG